MSDTEQELRVLLAETYRRSTAEIGLDEDLITVFRLDSLASLAMLAIIEKRFDVSFPDDQLGKYRTLAKILDWIAIEEELGA